MPKSGRADILELLFWTGSFEILAKTLHKLPLTYFEFQLDKEIGYFYFLYIIIIFFKFMFIFFIIITIINFFKLKKTTII